ncbi:MAG: PhoH family protein [Terrisporobacter sp.]
MIIQKKFIVSEEKFEKELFGSFDENIRLIEGALKIDVILRESNIVLMGEEKNVDSAFKLMQELQDSVQKGKSLDKQSISYSLSLLLEGSENKIKELEDVILLTKKRKPIQPKTLGFLPGDLKDKVDPYLRPLYDALFDILGADRFNKYLERGTIEVA